MAYVMSPPLKIAGGKRASPAGRAVRPELSTGTDVFVNITVDYVKY